MVWEAAFEELLHDTVSIQKVTGRDKYATPTYGAATSFQCRVSPRTRMTRTVDGQEVVSTCTVYIGGDSGVTVHDKITLPDGTTPAILQVRSPRDESGVIHHQEIIC